MSGDGRGSFRGTRSLLSYGLIVMTVTHVLTHVFGNIHTAIFSILRDEFSLSLQQLGLIAAIPPLVQALFAIPTGLLSDKIGSKKMVLTSFLVAAIGALLASQASNPLVLVVAVSLVYLNTTIYHPASYSYTTKLFSARDRPKAMGLHGAGGTLGHASGPLMVSVLIGLLAWQWRQVYLFLAFPMVLGIVMVFFLREETVKEVGIDSRSLDEENGDSSRLFTASLIMFLAFSALRMMGSSMIGSFLVLYLQDVRGLTIAFASLVASTTTLTGMVAAPVGGYMAAKLGEKKWILLSFGAGWVFLSLSILFPNVIWFTGLYVAYGFCNTLSMAARSSIMARLTPSRQRGLGYALFFLPGSIMGAIAPIIAGFLASSYSFNAIFYSALALYAASLAILKFRVKV
jgi:MFS family permease